MTDQTIEQEIQAKGLTAPRITLANIEAAIASEYYFTAADGVDGADIERLRLQDKTATLTLAPIAEESSLWQTSEIWPLRLLTFCVLVLRNGTKIVGINYGAIDPNQHDAERGKQKARAHAIDQVFPLMGYELRQKLYEQQACKTT